MDASFPRYEPASRCAAVALPRPRDVLHRELERTRLRTPSGLVSRYSIASIPPQECPSRCTRSRPNASRSAASSSTKVWTHQSDGSFGRSDRPQPIWSTAPPAVDPPAPSSIDRRTLLEYRDRRAAARGERRSSGPHRPVQFCTRGTRGSLPRRHRSIRSLGILSVAQGNGDLQIAARKYRGSSARAEPRAA